MLKSGTWWDSARVGLFASGYAVTQAQTIS